MSIYSLNNIIEYSNYNLFDISRRFVISNDIKQNPEIYQEYLIEGNESAEDIAQDFYGDPTLYWLIYLVNNIIDPFYGWVLSDYELNLFVDDKYGNGNSSNIHHGTITNLDFEIKINDNKRKIKIIKPNNVQDIINKVSKLYE